MKQTKFGIALAISMLFFAGCQKEANLPEQTAEAIVISNERNNPMSPEMARALDRPESWADCLLFAGVVTPAKFKPESDPFDELYMNNLGIGFKNGKALISESKPGDQDYNGGRWHLNVIKPTVSASKYAMACSVEDLDLNDFMSTPNYFECPLLPRR